MVLNYFSNPGGSDPGVVVAWDVALNLTHAFDGLEAFDLLGEISLLYFALVSLLIVKLQFWM